MHEEKEELCDEFDHDQEGEENAHRQEGKEYGDVHDQEQEGEEDHNKQEDANTYVTSHLNHHYVTQAVSTELVQLDNAINYCNRSEIITIGDFFTAIKEAICERTRPWGRSTKTGRGRRPGGRTRTGDKRTTDPHPSQV